MVEKAHERGLLVTLRPIIDERVLMKEKKGEWRGTIRPSNISAWFKNYTTILLEYAELGEIAGAQVFVIAAELNSMEKHTKHWRTTITALREKFSGRLTYSSNQGLDNDMPWDVLDYIGIDAFFELDTPLDNVTVDDMLVPLKRWAKWLTNRVATLKINRPIILAEIGTRPERGAHRKSWFWSNNQSARDPEEQRRFYEASCIAWKPVVSGIYWWNVTLNPPAEPLYDTDFSPLGKPAELAMADCYN
jgi:hypothetical protein